MSVFCGIDWGNSHHQVAVVNDAGVEESNRRYVHDRAGVDELVDGLVSVDDLVGVAIERSEGILVECLHAAGLAVFPVSPHVSARARERYQSATRRKIVLMRSCLLMRCVRMGGDGG